MGGQACIVIMNASEKANLWHILIQIYICWINKKQIAAESQTFSQNRLNLPQNKNHPSSGEPQPVHKK